jgi:hypothetical protein
MRCALTPLWQQRLDLNYLVRDKRKGIPLQINAGQPFLLRSQPYGVWVGGGTLDVKEVDDLG